MKRCVIIQFEADYPERVLNALLGAGAHVYDATFPARGTMRLTLSARDFKKLRQVRKQIPFSAHILGRAGSLGPLYRLRPRTALIRSGVAAAAALLFLSTRILVITVEGCQRVPEAAILRALSSEGIYAFAPRAGLELIPITDRIRAADDRISWMGLAFDGVICRVRVVESVPMQETLDLSAPSDVVARKSGVIAAIEPFAGKSLVSVGERVSEGSVLIAGDITAEEAEEQLLVHAYGRVTAYVPYGASHAADTVKRVLADTGESAGYRRIAIAGMTLFETKSPFAAYELRDVSASGPIGTLLPLRVYTGTYFEQTEQDVPCTREEMLDEAAFVAERLLYDRIPADARILTKNVFYEEIDGVIICRAAAVTREEIGMIKEIPD